MSQTLTENPAVTINAPKPATGERPGLTRKEIVADHPTWCPGCGDFSVLALYFKLIEKRKLWHEKITTISGIGCSSRFPYFVQAHGAHFIHGRALPFASGVSLSRPGFARLRLQRRRRRVFHRRQPLHAHRAQKHQDDARRHGQPGLRPHQKADLAHVAARFQEQDRHLGRGGLSDQSRETGHRRRRHRLWRAPRPRIRTTSSRRWKPRWITTVSASSTA